MNDADANTSTIKPRQLSMQEQDAIYFKAKREGLSSKMAIRRVEEAIDRAERETWVTAKARDIAARNLAAIKARNEAPSVGPVLDPLTVLFPNGLPE